MATPGRSAPALFSAGTVRRWARNGFLAGFLLGWLGSRLGPREDESVYEDFEVRALVGADQR